MVNVQFKTTLFLALFGLAIDAAPLRLNKRIAQVIAEATADWEQACRAAGGGLQCNPISVSSMSTLLAAAGPCDQQDAADTMIDLAKQLNNDSDMIRLAQLFAQQPRNTPSSEQVPYCQQAPKNSELNGLFQCQFATAAQKDVFVGGVPTGQAGTIPFGLSDPVSPPGTCPASPDAPIADGTQLNKLSGVQPNAPANNGANNGSADNNDDDTDDTDDTPTTVGTTPSATQAPSGGSGFQLDNAKAAQSLNAQFASLTVDSPCESGENACIDGDFAQCANGQFVTTPCGGGLTCVALPLVNSRGTSITCDTEADAIARIERTGATGGLTGNGSSGASSGSGSVPSSNPSADNTSTQQPNNAASSSDAASGDFRLQNAKDAQDLNAQFATLSADTACKDGENACIDGGFAQCANGQFIVTPCGGGLQCFALPLVNKAGTSITCDTEADALARIQVTGATGGITG